MRTDDWARRTLCPDGTCTGILDSRGVCGTCGKTGAAASGDRDPVAAEAEARAPVETPQEETPEVETPREQAAPSDDEWDRRTPCGDGACTGVVGPDGLCGTCGKRG